MIFVELLVVKNLKIACSLLSFIVYLKDFFLFYIIIVGWLDGHVQFKGWRCENLRGLHSTCVVDATTIYTQEANYNKNKNKLV